WSRITENTPGRTLAFASAGTVSSPAAYAPTMKKPICPNDSTPELPTNTYSATTIAANTSAFANSIARTVDRKLPPRPTSATRPPARARATGPISAVTFARLIPAPVPAEPAPPLFVRLRRAYGSCALHRSPGGTHEQPVRPDQEHHDDEREDGRVEVDAARERP